MLRSKEDSTIFHVSASLAVFILGIISSLIGIIYLSMTSQISQVKADSDIRDNKIESLQGAQQDFLAKATRNIAVICATVAQGKCEQ